MSGIILPSVLILTRETCGVTYLSRHHPLQLSLKVRTHETTKEATTISIDEFRAWFAVRTTKSRESLKWRWTNPNTMYLSKTLMFGAPGYILMSPNLWMFTLAARPTFSSIVLRQSLTQSFDVDFLTYPNYLKYQKGSKSGSETRTYLVSVSTLFLIACLTQRAFNSYLCPLPTFICYHALCFFNLLFVAYQQIYGYSDH
jgi:hypothetical protein